MSDAEVRDAEVRDQDIFLDCNGKHEGPACHDPACYLREADPPAKLEPARYLCDGRRTWVAVEGTPFPPVGDEPPAPWIEVQDPSQDLVDLVNRYEAGDPQPFRDFVQKALEGWPIADGQALDARAHAGDGDTAAAEAGAEVTDQDLADMTPPVLEGHDPEATIPAGTLIAGRTPIEAAEVLGKALAEHAQNAAAVEATERAYAGAKVDEGPRRELAPIAGSLPFPPGRFDPDAAFAAIERQWETCQTAADIYEDLKGQASEARATLEKEEKTLRALIKYHHEKRAKDAVQPTLAELPEAERADLPTVTGATCAWEKDNPGRRCPICRSTVKSTEAPSTSSREHPQHKGHTDLILETKSQAAAKVSSALRDLKFYVTPLDLLELTDQEYGGLEAWAKTQGTVPPPLMLRAHIAGLCDEDSGIVQSCQRCGANLWKRDHHGAMGIRPYPLDALVNLDCQGEAVDGEGQPIQAEQLDALEKALENAPPAAEPETARKPSRRGTKAKGTRHNPDEERKAQAKEGRAKKPAGEVVDLAERKRRRDARSRKGKDQAK